MQWAAAASGDLIVGCPATYELDRIKPNGTVVRFSLDKSPILSIKEERDWWVSGIEESRRRRAPGWSWVGPRPPEALPFYRRILVGASGRVWLWPGLSGDREFRRGQEVWTPKTTGAFDVFEPDGTFRGSVALPEGAWFRPFPGLFDPYIAGDTVWILRQDSLDVIYLSRMLIEW